MRLWVGLGNPEPGMARQRHNIGFMALDSIAARHGFGPWRARFRGMVAEGSIGAEKILLLKPMTYMNLSGESVQPAAAFYRLDIGDITAFHDELDILPGAVRIKKGGGAAGHNGLRSMDRQLGSQDYWRVRLGIGHPGTKERVVGHVLSDFGSTDRLWLDPLLDRAAAEAPLLVEQKMDEFLRLVSGA